MRLVSAPILGAIGISVIAPRSLRNGDSDLGPVGQSNGHSAQSRMVNEVVDFPEPRPGDLRAVQPAYCFLGRCHAELCLRSDP
jgi:hypothetical protein